MGSGGGGGGGNDDSPPPVRRTAPSTMVERGRGRTTSAPPPRVVAPPPPDPEPITSNQIRNALIAGANRPSPIIDRSKDTANRAGVVDASVAPEPARPVVQPSETPAFEKSREVGVRYGFDGKATIMKTSARSGELARELGPSPGDVLATVGAIGDVDRDTAAANIAGRPGLNVENLGNLATRARVGQMPDVAIPGMGGVGLNVLNTIGAASTSRLLEKLAADTPTIEDGQITYKVEPVIEKKTDRIVGVVEPGLIPGTRVYSGDPRFDPVSTGKASDKGPIYMEPEQPGAGDDEPDPVVQEPIIEPPADDEPDTQETILGRGRGGAAKRRTRGTRVGGAGSFEEGFGVLLRGPQATQPSRSGRLT